MPQTATPKQRRTKPTKAEHFGRHAITAGIAECILYTAQDAEGRYYGDYSLALGRCGGLKDRRHKLTPAGAAKFDTLEDAADHSLNEAFVQVEAHQHQLREVNQAKEAQHLQPLADALSDASTAEVAAALRESFGSARHISRETSVSDPAPPAKEIPAATPPADGDAVRAIPLDHLVDHPGNPDPTQDEVLQMVDWLQREQQQEPLTVRPHGSGGGCELFEVLAGKTRLAAARLLGWSELLCRVRDDLSGAAAAAKFAATNNAMRRTENPLRKIRWVKHLIEQQGMPVAEAGQVYGWSESYTRSCLGLMGLPPQWLQRIEAGEIAPTVALRLNPYKDCKPVMAELERRWKRGGYQQDALRDKSTIGNQIRRAVDEVTRPVEPKAKRNYGYSLGNEHPCYIDLTPEVESKLDIVQLPIGKNGKLQRVALNAKAYDALQTPLIKQRLQARQGGGKAKSKGKQAKLTPAQEKAEAKRKRAEADEKLAKQLITWRHYLLRLGCAETLLAVPPGAWQIGAYCPLLMLASSTWQGGSAHSMAPLAELWELACRLQAEEHGELPPLDPAKQWIERARAASDLVLYAMQAVGANEPDHDETLRAWRIQQWLCYLLLWPRLPHDTELVEDETAAVNGCTQQLPWGGRLPPLEASLVEQLANVLGVTMAQQWAGAAEAVPDKLQGGPADPLTQQRELLRVYLELHTRDQLTDLAREICTSLHVGPPKKGSSVCTSGGWQVIAEQKTKAAAVEALLAMHTAAAPLKLPAELAPPAAAKKTSKRKGKRA